MVSLVERVEFSQERRVYLYFRFRELVDSIGRGKTGTRDKE